MKYTIITFLRAISSRCCVKESALFWLMSDTRRCISFEFIHEANYAVFTGCDYTDMSKVTLV